MSEIFASIFNVPTFKNNYVKDGMVASYDNVTGTLEVKKTDLIEDTDPKNNVYIGALFCLSKHIL